MLRSWVLTTSTMHKTQLYFTPYYMQYKVMKVTYNILFLPTDDCSVRQSDECDTSCSCKDQQINESTGISAFIFIVRVLDSEETINIHSHSANQVIQIFCFHFCISVMCVDIQTWYCSDKFSTISYSQESHDILHFRILWWDSRF